MIAKIYIILAILAVGALASENLHKHNETTDGISRYNNDTYDDDIDEDKGDLHITNLLGTFSHQFEDMSDNKRHEYFESKVVPQIDANHDGVIHIAEVKDWIIRTAEEGIHADIPKEDYEDMDTNKDKKLSLEEVIADYKKHHHNGSDDSFERRAYESDLKKEAARFRFADSNKDGFITDDELRRLVSPEHFRDSSVLLREELLIEHDTNGDGIITKKEYQRTSEDQGADAEFIARHFESHDLNKDGKLDKDEIDEYVKKDSIFYALNDELKNIFLTETSEVFTGLSVHDFADLHHYFTDTHATLTHTTDHDEL